jgi:hypothetical protein
MGADRLSQYRLAGLLEREAGLVGDGGSLAGSQTSPVFFVGETLLSERENLETGLDLIALPVLRNSVRPSIE